MQEYWQKNNAVAMGQHDAEEYINVIIEEKTKLNANDAKTCADTRNTGLFGAAERAKEINGRLTGRKRTYGSTG